MLHEEARTPCFLWHDNKAVAFNAARWLADLRRDIYNKTLLVTLQLIQQYGAGAINNAVYSLCNRWRFSG
jgi:hypothetical protein